MNGDGYADLIVGAYGANGGAGRAYVVYGGATNPGTLTLGSLTAAQGYHIGGNGTGTRLGFTVASAGDVNGDGRDDLVIGTIGDGRNGLQAGGAFVLYGGAANPDIPTLILPTVAQGFSVYGAASYSFTGYAVASAGDVNGDGYADVLLGAYGSDSNGLDAGTSYVIYGGRTNSGAVDLAQLTATQGFRVTGAAAYDNSGRSVAPAGDVDGDGYADLLIGAPGADPSGRSAAGSSYVVFGEPTSAVFRTAGPAGGRLVGGDFDDRLTGGVGADTLEGRDGNDTLVGGLGNDSLLGGAGADSLLGGGGADTLDGGAGNDVMAGGAGDDTYVVDARGDAVTEAANGGTDTVVAGISYALGAELENLVLSAPGLAGTGNGLANQITGSAGNDALSGLGGNDTLLGGAGNDALDGGDDDDLLGGGTGSNLLIGGAGLDTATYAAATAGVTLNLGSGTASYGTGATGALDALSGIENAVGSGYADSLTGDAGANRLEGLAGNDVLDGSAGDDVLLGGAGDDTLLGGVGADRLDGGDGLDTASYALAGAGVSVSLLTGTGTGSDAGGDTLVGIENLVGSGHADSLTGDSGANRLDGGVGDDILVGGAGADMLVGGTGTDTASYAGATAGVSVNLLRSGGTAGDAAGDTLSGIENLAGSDHADALAGNAGNNVLSGGDGNDILIGYGGADVLSGGGGYDVADYRASKLGVTVDLGTGLGAGGDAEGDTLLGIERVLGSTHDDHLVGGDADDRLEGGAGDDGIEGGDGNDLLYGGTGNDDLHGEAGADSLHGGDGTDLLDGGAGSDRLYGEAGGDLILGGSGADMLQGGDGDDTLQGGADADQLLGGAGDDILSGGLGADRLTGGDGADRFVWGTAAESAPAARDLVTDFDGGAGDRLDLSAFDAAFVGTGAFVGGGDASVGYRVVGTGVEVRADTDGDGALDFAVVLRDVASLSANDFIL